MSITARMSFAQRSEKKGYVLGSKTFERWLKKGKVTSFDEDLERVEERIVLKPKFVEEAEKNKESTVKDPGAEEEEEGSDDDFLSGGTISPKARQLVKSFRNTLEPSEFPFSSQSSLDSLPSSKQPSYENLTLRRSSFLLGDIMPSRSCPDVIRGSRMMRESMSSISELDAEPSEKSSLN